MTPVVSRMWVPSFTIFETAAATYVPMAIQLKLRLSVKSSAAA